MTNNENNEYGRIDRILLMLRRLFVILFIFLVVWIILFKILKINKGDIVVDSNGTGLVIDWNDVEDSTFENLWNNYSKEWNNIYYKWDIIAFVDTQTFKVLENDEVKNIAWMLINSNNLLKIFASYDTRNMLMKNIDQIIKKEENVTDQLKKSSENGMYKMKNEYDILSEFDRGDRYDMTNQQRAKFAMMFLYIKIIKKQSNDKVSMSKALNELKTFLENFDKNDLKKEVEDKELNKIKWDIWIDNDCLYVNGELYACFLDELFVR